MQEIWAAAWDLLQRLGERVLPKRKIRGSSEAGNRKTKKRYNDLIIKQYSEIWGNYGPLTELWFDGGFVPPWLGGPPIMELRGETSTKSSGMVREVRNGSG